MGNECKLSIPLFVFLKTVQMLFMHFYHSTDDNYGMKQTFIASNSVTALFHYTKWRMTIQNCIRITKTHWLSHFSSIHLMSDTVTLIINEAEVQSQNRISSHSRFFQLWCRKSNFSCCQQ